MMQEVRGARSGDATSLGCKLVATTRVWVLATPLLHIIYQQIWTTSQIFAQGSSALKAL